MSLLVILLSVAQPIALAAAEPVGLQSTAAIAATGSEATPSAEQLPEPAPTGRSEVSPAGAPRLVMLPKLTPVVIKLVDGVGSNFSQAGQHFAIEVGRDVTADGAVVIPAGTRGVGEVIHAKKSGGSGSGGELIVIADYIELGDREIPLRSLQMSGTGGDRDGETMAVTMAVGPLGLLVKGRPIEFGPGFVGNAKLAADTQFEMPERMDAAAPSPGADAPVTERASETNPNPAAGAGQDEPQGSVQHEGVTE